MDSCLWMLGQHLISTCPMEELQWSHLQVARFLGVITVVVISDSIALILL